MSNLNITGRDKTLRNLEKKLLQIKGATEKGLVRAGLLAVNKSSRLVPVDTGNLRSSVYLVSNKAINHLPSPSFSNKRGDSATQLRNYISALKDARSRVSGKNLTVEIGYATNYAAAVHERTSANYRVGQAKYLEMAIKANAQTMVRIIEKEAKP